MSDRRGSTKYAAYVATLAATNTAADTRNVTLVTTDWLARRADDI